MLVKKGSSPSPSPTPTPRFRPALRSRSFNTRPKSPVRLKGKKQDEHKPTVVHLPLPHDFWRHEARVCVNTASHKNATVYPNYLFDTDGELVCYSRPGTLDLTSLITQQTEGIEYASRTTGLLLATNGQTKGSKVRLGTFFQVSPTHAFACYHTTLSHPDYVGRFPDVWVSKACNVYNWEVLFRDKRCRAKYFRRAKILVEQEEERMQYLTKFGLEEHCLSGLTPPIPVDFLLIELPVDYSNDPYLKPLPRAKMKTVKKVGVIAYNQPDKCAEEQLEEVYMCTRAVPSFDHQEQFIHCGNKSLSAGNIVHINNTCEPSAVPTATSFGGNLTIQSPYLTYELSLLEGSGGGPIIPLTRPHYFCGMHSCAFSDNEPEQVCGFAGARTRNFNAGISFYHPAFLSAFVKFVLPTLPAKEIAEIKAGMKHEL